MVQAGNDGNFVEFGIHMDKLHQRQYGGFLKWGYPKIEGKSQTKTDDDWGYPYDLGNPHIDEGGYIWILIGKGQRLYCAL